MAVLVTRLRVRAKKAWRILRREWPYVLLDAAIVVGDRLWFTRPLPELGAGYFALLALLFRWRSFDNFILVRAFYWLLAFLFACVIATGLMPLNCLSKPGLIAVIASVPLTFAAARRWVGYSRRTFAYSFLPAAVVSFVWIGLANAPSNPAECAVLRSDPRVKVLLDIAALPKKRGFPRYVVRRPDHNDLIVVYRQPTPMKGGGEVAADRLDLATGAVTEITAIVSESIGLYYDQPRGKIYSINVDRMSRAHPKTLAILNADLELEQTLDFPLPGSDDYAVYVMPAGDWLLMRAEGQGNFLFDPDARVFYSIPGDREQRTPWDKTGCMIIGETGFAQLSPTRYLLAGGIDPILNTLTRAKSLCIYDVEQHKYPVSRHSGMRGAWDVALIPERNEVLADSVWGDEVWVFALDDLRLLRTFEIGPCLRPVAYDAKTGLGYAAECFSGQLARFDVLTGAIKDRFFIGKNARKIYVYDDLGVVVLSECGLFQMQHPPSP